MAENLSISAHNLFTLFTAFSTGFIGYPLKITPFYTFFKSFPPVCRNNAQPLVQKDFQAAAGRIAFFSVIYLGTSLTTASQRIGLIIDNKPIFALPDKRSSGFFCQQEGYKLKA